MTIKSLEELTAQIKAEIVLDIQTCRVPVTVANFSELHDSVDANCYGGLCEDDTADAMIDHFGGRDCHEGMPEGMMNMINTAFDTVDAWLKAKGHHDALRGVYVSEFSDAYEIVSFDGPIVRIAPEGGGFVMKTNASTFFRTAKLRAELPPFRAFLTGLDGTESAFTAYSNGKRWNGWAVPMFDKAQLLEIIILFAGDSFRFNEAEDVVEYYDVNEEEWIKQAPEEIDIDMGDGLTVTKKLYPLGDGWCWTFYGWWADLK
jgi:hypothetical protein